jgi:hypothetical protein
MRAVAREGCSGMRAAAREGCSGMRAAVGEVLSTDTLHLTRVGEVLSTDTLHHKHHAIVLLIPFTTPPHLAGPRRRIRRCVVRVQCSEAPVVALGLDRIARRRR